MQQKEDRRILKTKKSLGEALMRLLKEKKLEEVKINELCEEADISRATFYNNFDSIPEVIAFELDNILLGEDTIHDWNQKDVISLNKAYLRYLSTIIHNIIIHKDLICSLWWR